jgi:hypothetical protein
MTDHLDQAAKAGADAWQAEMKACTLDEAVRAMTFQGRVNVIVERTERARARAIIASILESAADRNSLLSRLPREQLQAVFDHIDIIRQCAGLEGGR